MDDLNTIFDDIALVENKAFASAFEEGVTKSRKEGFDEGYKLGLGKGLQVGTTIGFYRQFAEIHLNRFDQLHAPRREKLHQALTQLLNLIAAFDLQDPKNENLFTDLETIESKFKQVKALVTLRPAKLIPPRDKPSSLTF